ncbi:MAG: glutamine--fructose-6-phosphate transaminase (isomerizing), partial [Candidatus Saccharimonadales bacterium]
MCGIVGYIGKGETTDILLNGLRRLEYRGYDSAGVALADKNGLKVFKKKGRVDELAQELGRHKLNPTSGIAHTRWATHGEPSEKNSHPHVSGSFAVVHNGIIENYRELKAHLQKQGVKFVSDTDTEVLAHLINQEYQKQPDLVQAVTSALKHVIGSFGLGVVSSKEPGKVIAARRGSPLLLGVGDGEMFIASDAAAIIGHTNQVVYLEDDEVALCTADSYKISTLENLERERQAETINLKLEMIEKGGYDHFLIKEIMEQPQTLQNLLSGKFDEKHNTIRPGGINLTPEQARGVERLLVIGCGTAYYAGLIGKYLLERLTGIPVDVEFASEFRYRDPVLSPGTTGVIISQSGETADTLAS